jgi:two-component system cell cycle response regulator
LSSVTVLVVDDSRVSRAAIVHRLTEAGYATLEAADGVEGAMVALRELPDLVVTDLQMPVMDGYQLARLLKSDPSTREIPVLILTSQGGASSRFWSRETGADAYVTKEEFDTALVPAVERLARRGESSFPRTAEDAPRTPLEVLARVGRQLDDRLRESVVTNRLLEGGVRGASLRDSSLALLHTVADVVDAWLLGLVVSEPHSVSCFFLLDRGVSEEAAGEHASRLAGELGAAEVQPRVVAIGGRPAGRRPDPSSITTLELPLRGARALLALAPKGRWEGTWEEGLLRRVTPHLALVLDNARLAERLRDLSMQDGLTRLLNRRTVHLRLEQEIERARRYRHPLTVVLCDLDHFKRINDTHGHLAGDAALAAVAGLLRDGSRSSDVAGRYGGEEFLLLLVETGLDEGRSSAERLRRTLEEHETSGVGREPLRVTASFGVASLSELPEEATSDQLLGLADRRLYRAKEAGRNLVV